MSEVGFLIILKEARVDVIINNTFLKQEVFLSFSSLSKTGEGLMPQSSSSPPLSFELVYS